MLKWILALISSIKTLLRVKKTDTDEKQRIKWLLSIVVTGGREIEEDRENRKNKRNI